VVLTNNSKKLLHIAAKDELPTALESVRGIESIDVPPRFEYETTYDVRAIQRGRFKLGGMVLRVGRPGALIERQLTLPVEEDIKIYPRFATSDEYRLLARINQQDESVRRPRRTQAAARISRACQITIRVTIFVPSTGRSVQSAAR
jgi:uncharacterized protein (DUF58 family)